METKNFIQLNMMKRQLLNIYRTFEEKPELLDDPSVRKGYNALLSITDIEEIEQWSKLIEVLGLSYANTEGIEYKDNVLGELEDLISSADEIVLYYFVEFLCSFDASEWEKTELKNYRIVSAVQKMASRSYDVQIILVNCNSQWVAIGDDADRLFEIFGWQTSIVFNGENDVSFMYVSDYGYEVLKESGYSIETLFLREEENEDEVFFSDCFNEDLICANQQLIDYIRLLMRKNRSLSQFTSERAEFISPKSGFDCLVNSDIRIDGDMVVSRTDDNKEIVLADGRNWILDYIGLPYLINFKPLIGEA